MIPLSIKIRRGLRLLSRQQGQSLVELAIITPLLLLLFLGLTEVGAALRSYQIVVNTAREGARYGSKDEFIPNASIVDWMLSSTTLPIKLGPEGGPYEVNPQNATIIVTRLKQTGSGGDYEYEIEGTPYCEGACDGSRPSVITPAWLAAHAQETAALPWPGGVPDVNMKLIAVEVMYDHPQITGLFYIGQYLPNPIPMHSITIMRLGGSRVPQCDAYPIAVHESTLAGKQDGQDLGDIYNGFGQGNFGWLRWPAEDQGAGNEPYIVSALRNPKLSRHDFVNPMDPNDHWLNTGDWVAGNTGLSNSDDVRNALTALIGKKIRILVWDQSQGTGNNGRYHIIGFAWVEITSFDLPGDNRISAIFRGWDSTCSGASSH